MALGLAQRHSYYTRVIHALSGSPSLCPAEQPATSACTKYVVGHCGTALGAGHCAFCKPTSSAVGASASSDSGPTGSETPFERTMTPISRHTRRQAYRFSNDRRWPAGARRLRLETSGTAARDPGIALCTWTIRGFQRWAECISTCRFVPACELARPESGQDESPSTLRTVRRRRAPAWPPSATARLS